jgi:type II secretory pathway component PulM
MNRITAFLQAVRRHMKSPRLRHLPVVLATSAAIGGLVLLSWMPAQKARLDQREVAVGKELNAIQSDLAEFDRLKMRKPPPDVSVSTIHEALSASLASVGPSLSVKLVDTDRLRVQGNAYFDGVIRWLGDTQQSHRLSTVKMSVVRQKDDVVVDMTLSSRRQ